MKIIDLSKEDETMLAQLADAALRGTGLNADPIVQALKVWLSKAKLKEEPQNGSLAG